MEQISETLDSQLSQIPSHFNSLENYKNSFLLLQMKEFALFKQERTINSFQVYLEFSMISQIRKNGKSFKLWIVHFPIPQILLDPNSNQSEINPNFVHIGDKVTFKWDPSLNPIEIEPSFGKMKGRIQKIKNGNIYVIIQLPTTLCPPDYQNPFDLGIRRPMRILYTISFSPCKAVFQRKVLALNSLNNIDSNLMSLILNPRLITSNLEFPPDRINLSSIPLTQTQEHIAISAACRRVSVIQGPPGCGKKHTIGAISVACLQQRPAERILICGPSILSISPLIKTVGNIVTRAQPIEHPYKIVWIAESTKKPRSDNVSDEDRYLIFYQMMQLPNDKSRRYAELERQSWTRELPPNEIFEEAHLEKELAEEVCRDANIIVSTLDSSIQPLINKLHFETVIIADASQATESFAILPLVHGAKRLILVGDQNQLPPSKRFDELEPFDYYTSICQRFFNAGLQHFDFLDTQFRMHPDISHFSNSRFYGGRIVDGIQDSERRLSNNVESNLCDHHVNYWNLENSEEKQRLNSPSFYNMEEATSVVNIIRRLLANGVIETDIGVITPYGDQVRTIARELERYTRMSRVKISSVDGFQGDEKDYIIVSTVRNNQNSSIGFVADQKRINVMLTRARRALIVIGNERTFHQDPNWRSFIEYAKSIGGYQDLPGIVPYVRPHISSVFDVSNNSNEENN